ncbi:hypothetical protein PGB90_002602 [Kerria lacca]
MKDCAAKSLLYAINAIKFLCEMNQKFQLLKININTNLIFTFIAKVNDEKRASH